MNDFTHYHSPDPTPNPRPHGPVLPWMAWGLVNILSLATICLIMPLLKFVPEFDLVVLGVCVVAPAFAAGFLDGRMRVVSVLTLSGWAVLLVGLYFWSQSDAWRQDCGLGVGFAMLFSAIAAAAYPAIMAAGFAVGRALNVGLGLVHTWTKEDDRP